MANSNLSQAKKAKNDEFYTQFADIEKEILSYLDFNPNTFRGKTILLPCDDPEWSNFTKFFALNFDRFRLKELISTSYAGNKLDGSTKGKIYRINRDINFDEKINIEDLQCEELEGDGDFRSEEVSKLRDEADIIITNPPFSLFREFLAWIIDADKKFITITNKNCVTYKEVFPLFRDNRLWSGCRNWSGGMWFETKNEADIDRIENGINMKNVPSIWLTNLDHGRRHKPLDCATEADVVRFDKKTPFEKYDNYDAIEVPFTRMIPSDYPGVMGVPISFLDKYCPKQFEILGSDYDIKIGLLPKLLKKEWKGKTDRGYLSGKRMYSRILIKHKK